jgi:hypothetical protein
MNESTNRPLPDEAHLNATSDDAGLLRRLRALGQLRYSVVRTRIEIAAIAQLLDEGTITAGELWQLLLPQYNIASSVSSTPRETDDPSWLAPVHADQQAIWENLTNIVAGNQPAELMQVPAPYAEVSDSDPLLELWLADLAQQLNMLERRYYVSPEQVLDALSYELRHGIEHHLAVQWFGGPFAVGASLYALPLPGGIGRDGQILYFLKAMVGNLRLDLDAYRDLSDDTETSQETLGRIMLWWTLIKGFTYGMLNATGSNIPAMLLNHEALITDLKAVLTEGVEVVNRPGRAMTPQWGSRRDCRLHQDVAETPTPELLAALDNRLAAERDNADIQSRL